MGWRHRLSRRLLETGGLEGRATDDRSETTSILTSVTSHQAGSVNIQSKTLSSTPSTPGLVAQTSWGIHCGGGTHGGFPRSAVTPSLASSHPSANKPVAGASSTGRFGFAGLNIWISSAACHGSGRGGCIRWAAFPSRIASTPGSARSLKPFSSAAEIS